MVAGPILGKTLEYEPLPQHGTIYDSIEPRFMAVVFLV